MLSLGDYKFLTSLSTFTTSPLESILHAADQMILLKYKLSCSSVENSEMASNSLFNDLKGFRR